jgi:hypothetical protein
MTVYTLEQQRDNRQVLAAYLGNLPPDYQGFEMQDFFQSLSVIETRLKYRASEVEYCALNQAVEEAAAIANQYARENGGVAKCGAVACAVGHGPSAGFLAVDSDFNEDGDINWWKYRNRVFLSPLTPNGDEAFYFLFGGDWSAVDNTPQGAARRLEYYDAFGIPDSFDSNDPDTYHAI